MTRRMTRREWLAVFVAWAAGFGVMIGLGQLRFLWLAYLHGGL